MKKEFDINQFCIIDTTMRDGSYVLNFQFTLEQNRNIVRALDECGINYIEVGHGVGLGASRKGKGQALHSDKEYIRNASDNVKHANIGVFCIPGISSLNDIDEAVESGIKFIRIGTNANEVNKSFEYIKRAKQHNLKVFSNYMKSYCLPPKEFAQNVKISEDYGVDGVYIVDSAGGMNDLDIYNYYSAIREVSNISVGFHGHNNLGLANANNLKCVEFGFDFVDTSLQGLGRGAGNASTELFVLALIKKGINIKVDYYKLLEYSSKYVKPLVKSGGIQPLDAISGFADFHSSYMSYIEDCSNKYGVNPLELIVEYSKCDRININENKLEEVAFNLKYKSQINYDFSLYYGNEQK